MTILHTERLRLEPFCDAHIDGLTELNRHPEVMRYITGKPATRDDTIAMIELVKPRWVQYGFSWWSFFEKSSNELIGAGCIQYLGRDPANPHEIGWRLRPDKWGQGFAMEAAIAMANFAFDELHAPELVAVCMPENTSSSGVMKKLGMTYRGQERWYDMDTAVYGMSADAWRNHSETASSAEK